MKNTTGVLFGRLMKHILRSPDTIITVALTPIAMMLMFVYVFGGAVKTSLGDNVNYVNYQLPGILLMAIASGIAYTAFRLFMDMQKGLFARFNSMPISRSSVLSAIIRRSSASGSRVCRSELVQPWPAISSPRARCAAASCGAWS